ncbi:MAG: hypothetical protein JXB46_03660 [Candidatus Eisenbacteria bacterium]|nr:hypothetical protein [Candidatus Eisenbacteria bacterium]
MKALICVPVIAVLLATVTGVSGQTCDESVVFRTYDGTIEMAHAQALNNCCCSIEAQVALEGYVLDIHENEILEGGGCDCLCCFDIDVVVCGLEPGDYAVTVIRHTEYGGTEYLGPWVVTVAGMSAPSVSWDFVPCVETAIDESAVSWGIIKALYK